MHFIFRVQYLSITHKLLLNDVNILRVCATQRTTRCSNCVVIRNVIIVYTDNVIYCACYQENDQWQCLWRETCQLYVEERTRFSFVSTLYWMDYVCFI